MKLLVVGGAGYIGSVLVSRLLADGHQVRVVDLLWFNSSTPLIHFSNPKYEFIRGDMRDTSLMVAALVGIDFVLCPAAVVGDPASKKYPDLTSEINDTATKGLIDLCRERNVAGFFFFSTCSNYGVSDGIATEETSVNPVSLYAETKVSIERYLTEQVDDMDWVIGRLSTVYGSSPRMRFDLTVNEFALKGYVDKYIDIFRPESYRPYVHTYDLANIIGSIINRFDAVKNNIFNIGFEGENYQKIQIASAVQRFVPDLKIDILKEGGDMRDYQVDFSKLRRHLDIKRIFDVEKAVEEVIRMFDCGLIEDYSQPMYSNTTPNIG